VNELLNLVSRYGYLLIFSNLFLESVGLPIPAAPILVAAGAAAALGSFKILNVLLIALVASLLGDLLLFLAGRYTGWAILGFLCRLSVNPETCILRSAESFYKRGRLTLVFSKFLPGINTMAPPIAGSMNMRLAEFLGLDLLAASLYISLFAGLGFFFSHLVSALADGIASLCHMFYWALLLGLVVYLIYRLRNYWKGRLYRNVARVSARAGCEACFERGQLQGVGGRYAQPWLLRPGSHAHSRLAAVGSECHSGRNEPPAEGEGNLPLLHLTARGHERPCGAHPQPEWL